jgi:large subunit ribosomal protein L30
MTIAAIRIIGMNKMDSKIEDTLQRLRLRKKYTLVFIKETPDMLGMLEKIKNFIAYGKVEEKTIAEVIKARGKVLGDTKAKVKDSEKIAKEMIAGKNLEELKIKPFFGMHPARGGIDTKHHYPKGVIGKHEDISKLIMKML